MNHQKYFLLSQIEGFLGFLVAIYFNSQIIISFYLKDINHQFMQLEALSGIFFNFMVLKAIILVIFKFHLNL
jgi:hypothetical protein